MTSDGVSSGAASVAPGADQAPSDQASSHQASSHQAASDPTPFDPTPGGRPSNWRQLWLGVAIAAWTVLLMILTYLSVGHDDPTVREQRSITQAMPVVHRALGDLVAAAGPDVVVELSPATLTPGCRVTPFRDGATLEQAIVFRTTEADAPELLDRLAQNLPPGYRASVRHGAGDAGHSLYADAGEFVVVRGAVGTPGVVRLAAKTGCRPTDDNVEIGNLLPATSIDDEPGRVLSVLGASAVQPGPGASVACLGDGAIRTARATGQGPAPQALGAALRPLAGAGAVVVIDRSDLYAYRSGPLSVVVEVVDGELRVAVTESCQP